MGLVTRALLTAGGLLLVLVAGVTWLVTRQVVTPVRLARRVAERLAAGRLQERLRVTGEDDLARLATSFNQMAIEPAAPDPPARGAQPGPAPVRLRRLPRAAYAADHRADGGRRPARRPPATSTPRPPAPPSCSRPSSTASRRCWPTCWRSAGSTPAPPCSRPTTSTSSTWRTGSWTPPGRWPSSARSRLEVRRARPPVPRRGRRTPGRADRPQPGHQRHRPRPPRRPAHRHRAGRHPGRRRRPGGGDRGARLRRRAGAGRVVDGLQPVLARRPGPRAHQRRHRPRPVDLAWRTPTCTAAGCRPGAGPARARSSGSPCRAGSGDVAAAEPAAAGARGRPGAGRDDPPYGPPPWPRRSAGLVLAGCGVTMPDSGPVVETRRPAEPRRPAGQHQPAPAPAAATRREEIVRASSTP